MMSRSNALPIFGDCTEKVLCLIPMWDMVNHKHKEVCYMVFNNSIIFHSVVDINYLLKSYWIISTLSLLKYGCNLALLILHIGLLCFYLEWSKYSQLRLYSTMCIIGDFSRLCSKLN